MYVPEPFKKAIRNSPRRMAGFIKLNFSATDSNSLLRGLILIREARTPGAPDLMRTSLMELPVVCESDIEALLQRCAEELKVGARVD